MNNVKKFNYLSSVKYGTSMTHRKIIKTIYKVNSNKTFEINEIINKVLQ